MDTAKGLIKISDAVARVLRAPVAAEVRSARTLTNLSSAARIRCFEALASKPPDWLVKDMDGADACRRWMILAAGSHEALIARFADFLEGHQAAPRPKRTPSVKADRSFGAYVRLMHAVGARA
ncbi:hypothetical protein [Mesorhizobium sp. M0276]|uniref:hypothetical protein n=1 Tax=Mesorhizobium sp. M0276 TaxID=2956928 RepID=UPI00333CB4B4